VDSTGFFRITEITVEKAGKKKKKSKVPGGSKGTGGRPKAEKSHVWGGK